MSTITALAPWFGGKRTMANVIVGALGPHSVYWEPFCGSMAVLLGKPPCKVEVVNDLHGDLVNLARVVRDPRLGPALYRRLRRTWSCQALFLDSLEGVRSEDPPADLDLDRAYHYFVASWQGVNGTAGTRSQTTRFARRFTATGGGAGTRWASAVRSIPGWRRRMERVEILRSDGIELCERIDDAADTVIYADPPYLKEGSKYLHGFTAADHERLARALGRFARTRVVLSYYDDPALERLYPGWRKRLVDVAKGLANSGHRGKEGRTEAPEILLTNLAWPDRDEPGMLF